MTLGRGPECRNPSTSGQLEPKGDTVGVGTYLAVSSPAEVDAVYARALGAGAVGVWGPALTEWENYRCRMRDLEGREWTFGTHIPGEPAADWSDD